MKIKNKKGFSFIEVNLAVAVIGIIVIASGTTYVAAYKAAVKVIESNRSSNLALGLMEEILSRQWDQDPAGASTVLNPEAGETIKSKFNDIDDFNNYLETPPQYPDGAPMTGFDGYARAAVVSYVDQNLITSTTATKRKLVTVTISKYSKPVFVISSMAARK